MELVRKAEEMMIPLDKYPHVSYWFTLRQVVEIMEKYEFDVGGRKSLPRFALVFDEEDKLLGLVRRRDVFRGLEPKFLATKRLEYSKKLFNVEVDENLSEMFYDKFLRGIREQAERPVKDVMRPIQAKVNHDDHIVKVIYEMVEYNVSLLPVLKNQKVIGVVRSVELFHEVGKLILGEDALVSK